jgi:hypothetical protein
VIVETPAPRPADDYARVYDFDDVPIGMESSSAEVLAALDRIMRARAHVPDGSPGVVTVAGERTADTWSIRVDGRAVRGLPLANSPPLVAEELIATACAVAARRRLSILIRGPVLERGGEGVALIGDDLDSAKALALHLHARHWTAVSFGYSFLNPHSLNLVGLQSLAAISSTSISRIPRRYRRAIEASKWYDSGSDLTFYAVDPHLVHPGRALSTTLTRVIVIDGTVASHALLDDSCDASEIGFLANHPLADSIRVAKMTLGSPIASCDSIESWASLVGTA